jgi:glycine/D-amino acid oxidase-like deaminating enzyme
MGTEPAGRYDAMVVGGGMVGSAMAYGLSQGGARVALLDEGDLAMRAARGNFGLVWTQSKGVGMPAYVSLTRESAARWHGFSEEMAGHAGRDIGYRQQGGLDFCLGEAAYAERSAHVARLHNQSGTLAPNTVMLDRKELEALLPGTRLGPLVVGASLCRDDGHVNPLYLLRGLHAGIRAAGGTHLPGAPVTAIDARAGGFVATRADGSEVWAERVIVAAGIATTRLAAMVGITLPVRPVRGQNIVTERLPPILPLPASALRQTAEGVIQIGVTIEETDDPSTTVAGLAKMAARAVKVLPELAHARMVRAWGALRPMTPDGFPAYAASTTHPGAFACAVHSGVTLAAAHAQVVAPAILAGDLSGFAAFDPSRFGDQPVVRSAH